MPERGTDYGSERISLTDPETGAEYTQLTNAPVHSRVLYFEQHSFTADNRTLLFLSQRIAKRGAPWDVYRVDADGMNLVQLSDEKHPFALPVPAHDDARLVYGVRDDALWSLDIDTFEETEISRCEELSDLQSAGLSGNGAYYLAVGTSSRDGTPAIARFGTDGSEAVTLCHGVPIGLMTCNHATSTLMFRGW